MNHNMYISHQDNNGATPLYFAGLHFIFVLSKHTVKFRKQAPGLIFFKGPFEGAYFWRGLYSEGLIYGGKFAFTNRLG